MASLSTYLKNALNNAVLRNTTYTSPTTVYLALFTTDPTNDNTGTEVSGGSYVRRAVTFSASSAGTSSNTADIIFPIATGVWGTITHGGIFDSLTGGNLLFHNALVAPKPISIGDIFKIVAGELINNLS